MTEDIASVDQRPHLDFVIEYNPDENRFEGYVDGALAGFVLYERDHDRLVLVHTEVDDAFEGQGVGSKLVAGVLDEIRSRGVAVVVQCPFIKRYISRHPEYADLVV